MIKSYKDSSKNALSISGTGSGIGGGESDSETISTKANTEIDACTSIIFTPSKAKRHTPFKSAEKITTTAAIRKGYNDAPAAVGVVGVVKKDTTVVHNHLENHFHLSNKKALFYNFRTYMDHIGEDPFKHIPLTFHIKEGTSDKEFLRFVEYYKTLEV